MGTRWSITVYDKDDGLFYKAQFPHDGDISCAGFELYMMAQEPTDVIKMVKTEESHIELQEFSLLKDTFDDSAYEYVLNNDGSISVTDRINKINGNYLYYSLEVQLMKLNLIPKTLRFRFLNLFLSKLIIMGGLEKWTVSKCHNGQKN